MNTVLKCGLNTQNAVTILTSTQDPTEAENIYITEIAVVVNAMLKQTNKQTNKQTKQKKLLKWSTLRILVSGGLWI